MPIHAVQAAECLCKTSDWNLSYLEVQKMLYISNMLYLGATGEPLVEGSFEAGNYGPVHPVLQCHLQSYGLNPIPKAAFNDFSYDKLDAGKKKILTGTAKHFKKTPKRKAQAEAHSNY